MKATRLTGFQMALVVVTLLAVGSLFHFAWLSVSQSPASTSHDEERLNANIDRLTETLADVVASQEQMQEILLRLAAKELANITQLIPTPRPKSSTKKDEDKDFYQPSSYKKWLAELGMTPTEQSCEDHTGLTLVERFREAKKDWCKNDGGNGRMECFHLPGWGSRHQSPDTICEAHNLVLDFGKLEWKATTEFDSSGSNRHFRFSKGAFSAQCEVDQSLNNFDSLFGPRENRFTRTMWSNFLGIPSDQPVAQCDVVYENPVLIIMRFEAWNLYHQLGEWINAFIALEVVGKRDKDTQVLLLDMHEKTEPYTDMLKVFSTDHPLVLGKEHVGKGKVCFKNAIMPHEGYGTFIHNNVWRAEHGEPCVHSDLLEGFSHFVLNKLGIMKHAIANEPRITLISRKDYMGRRIDRKIGNEDKLVQGIQEVCAGRASFTSVQLEEMTFKEQVEMMYSKTNILIGVHGAGLTHTIFLPPEAILIEIMPGGIRSFTYFRNLAKQSNHIYIPVYAGDNIVVDVEKMKKVIDVAISIASSFNQQMGKG